MPFQIIRNDITRVSADVIVNTANPHPIVGDGTDSAIYRAAGMDELLAERIKIGDIERGHAAVTPAFGLNAKYIIHTVGPFWMDGEHGERETLHACYKNSLELADGLKAESIAFPLIATGVYGFPKDEALNIALTEIGRFLLTHEMNVILVVFDRSSFELSGKLVGQIDEYIDEHGVGIASKAEYWGSSSLYRRRTEEWAQERIRELDWEAARKSAPASAGTKGKSLDDVIGSAGETFQQRLFRLIDESGMDDVTVYKTANVDRKVFSRIRCKADYRPKKRTAVAFAIALRLDMETMLDLLARAEIAFSPSNTFDLIIRYFVENGIYDIFEINAALFKYGEPILGENE